MIADLARTALLSTDVAGFLFRMAVTRPDRLPSTATSDGLEMIARSCERALEHAGVLVDVIGRERVPREGGIVFMWNQESHLDHLVLPTAIPRPFFSLYNNAVARFPFYGRHMARSGHVHVDRNDEAQWRTSVTRAAERVRGGECVLVSPEGTRSRGGALLPMKRGAFILAIRSQRPIVCVTVIGGHERLPRGSAIVRKGPMRIVLCEPIPTSGHDEEDREPLQERVVRMFEETKSTHAINGSAVRPPRR